MIKETILQHHARVTISFENEANKVYKISLIENGTKQNEITIADTVALFQFVHKLTTMYKGYSWDFISIELAEFVEFSSQCYIDIGYNLILKIEEC